MNKKIFGIRIGTIISVFASFIVAIVFWLFVKYAESDADLALSAFRAADWLSV